jgi:molybdopterin molybdotransferase
VRPLIEAQRDVLAAMKLLPVVEVPLREAGGLVLAGDVTSPHDVPPFANSAVDGFAVRAADTERAPVELSVLEDVPAGRVARHRVEQGTATKIMTGAPVPDGADAVVPVEVTTPAGGRIRIETPVAMGDGVRPAGGDVGAGVIVFGEGERLGPAHLGVLAAIGVAHPTVRRRPRVAVMSTGDEVRPADTQHLDPGTIRDANRPMIVAMLAELGAEVTDLGIVPDDAVTLRSTLERAAAGADAVVTSGGVSVGEYDLVKQVLGEMGDVAFWRVAMQPAKPFAFGFIGETPLFGLPGNPVSVVVAFEQFVRPALLRRMGSTRLFRPRVGGITSVPLSTDPEKTVFVRVATFAAGEGWVATPSGAQVSNVLSGMARSDAFAVVPVGVGDLGAGDAVELEMFRWPERRTAEEVIG